MRKSRWSSSHVGTSILVWNVPIESTNVRFVDAGLRDLWLHICHNISPRVQVNTLAKIHATPLSSNKFRILLFLWNCILVDLSGYGTLTLRPRLHFIICTFYANIPSHCSYRTRRIQFQKNYLALYECTGSQIFYYKRTLLFVILKMKYRHSFTLLK